MNFVIKRKQWANNTERRQTTETFGQQTRQATRDHWINTFYFGVFLFLARSLIRSMNGSHTLLLLYLGSFSFSSTRWFRLFGAQNTSQIGQIRASRIHCLCIRPAYRGACVNFQDYVYICVPFDCNWDELKSGLRMFHFVPLLPKWVANEKHHSSSTPYKKERSNVIIGLAKSSHRSIIGQLNASIWTRISFVPIQE